MISVSNDFKTRTKKIKQQNIKLGIVSGELTVKEVHFMTVKEFNSLPVWMLRKRQEVIAKELKYSFEGNLFKTIMKQIEITVKNAGELKDKNVNFQYGIYVNNDFEYIDLGDYYIKDVEDDKGKTELVVTGYDKMIHFMKTFKQSELQLTYPCTMLTLIQKMCEVCGVGLYSTNFFNADLQVDEDYFTTQELTYRDVLEKVAESTETTIFIKDNKLYLHKLTDSSVEKLDASYLTGLTVKEKFGPVNALVLGRGDVEDNIEAKDDTSIAQNGRCEIRFDENEFVEYQREQVIDEMFEQIKGIEYYAFEGSDVGVMWLEPCDLFEVEDNEESTYKTIYLKANITINTGISSDIEASIPEETNTEYKVTTKEEKKTLKVERLAKKNEGQIQDLIQETTEQGQKLTQVEQTVDGITQTVNSVETKIEQVEDKADNAQTSANNAQSTADGAVNQITTTNQKVSQIEQTVSGITQSVSEVEEKVETVETKADNAQNTANNINNNLTQNYYTKTETNSQINQKADSITSEVSKTYSTKAETTNAKSEAINSANASTDEKLQDYTEIEELGTLIEQNWEHVKVAWNQISQYIQLEGDNGDATMGFYDNNTKFAEMGVNTINDDRYISFAIPVDYSQSISDGMAWGVQTKTDNKFHPILYVKNFTMQDENSEGCTGELVLDGCDLVLGAINSGIISNNVKIHGDALPGVYFTDTSTGRMLLGIIPANGISEDSIYILDNISFYRNAAGSNSFKIGNDNGCLFSDDGHILCENLNCNQNVYIYGYLDAIQGIRTQGYVSGKAFIDNSREETKKNIEKFNKNAVEIIKNTDIYEFNYKTEKEKAKKHLGFVIGENYNYTKEITAEDDESKEIGADLYSMISVAYKAIQEQQETIESLKSEIEKLKENK